MKYAFLNNNFSGNRKQKTKEQDSFFSAPGSEKVFLGDARSKDQLWMDILRLDRYIPQEYL